MNTRSFLTHCLIIGAMSTGAAFAGERQIIQLMDFRQTELRGAGFTLTATTKLHISALGTGEKDNPFSTADLYSYGWIINADTRDVVWKMDRSNTQRQAKDRRFDGTLTLSRGSYEVYFSAYGSSFASVLSKLRTPPNPPEPPKPQDQKKRQGFLEWLQRFFGDGKDKDWIKRAQFWGIEISADERDSSIVLFNIPTEFPHTVYKATRLGDNRHIRQRFTVSRPVKLRIYALGERDYSNDLADGGRILETRTHRTVWTMDRAGLARGGGAEKNVLARNQVTFPAGDYILYYNTDDSHSYQDWNDAPPWDPYHYGIVLYADNEDDRYAVTLVSTEVEEHNVIVQMVRVGNDQTRHTVFTLKDKATVRLFAVGESDYSRTAMVDFAWLINERTREKVWVMDVDRTEPAGGDPKNRMIDETITLPAATYGVYYHTDDSHAFNSWNTDPPYEPDFYGITIYGAGEHFSPSVVEKNVPPAQAGIIAQIVGVGNNANESRRFMLSQTTHVRIYALGEGRAREMYDYGWIENASSGAIVWEMTGSMTFHAGGDRKNRSVSTTIMLDKGEYILHYVSDDSHSTNDWNADPPDDPTMWGITLYREG